ncbi:unnamed protein product, partial [Rotaria sp. Silwood2]
MKKDVVIERHPSQIQMTIDQAFEFITNYIDEFNRKVLHGYHNTTFADQIIAPIADHMSNVCSFVDLIRPSIDAYYESIENLCDPSATVTDLNCIIATVETRQGALQVNKQRQENGLSQLAVHVLPMIPADNNNQDGDNKLSSTSFRRQIFSILLIISYSNRPNQIH